MADNTTQLAQLRAIRDSGVLQGTVDGQVVRYRSLAEINAVINHLEATDDATAVPSRPRSGGIDLSGVLA
ncbi:MAG: hypothetical protein AAFY08_15675 [Planctomycetota bacterium]